MNFSKILQKAYTARTNHTFAAVVPAAGLSSRMKGQDKLFIDLCGTPVLARTLLILQNCDYIKKIVIVTRSDLFEKIQSLIEEYHISKALDPIEGGATRCESVYRGIMAIPTGITHVAIHDGARPLLSKNLLERVLLCGGRTAAAAPGISVSDTIKQVSNGYVEKTLPRHSLLAIQTPQVFDIDIIKAALTNAINIDGSEITDDCSAVEAIGGRISIVEGDRKNLKITTPEDLLFAKALLEDSEK